MRRRRRKSSYDVQFPPTTLRLPKEDRETLEVLANSTNRSMSQVVHDFLQDKDRMDMRKALKKAFKDGYEQCFKDVLRYLKDHGIHTELDGQGPMTTARG